MYCYDEEGICLGVIACFPKKGEEHMWDDDLYICTGEVHKNGCRTGIIFRKIIA